MKHQSNDCPGDPIQRVSGFRERSLSAMKRAFAIFLILCPLGSRCIAREIYVSAESQTDATDGSKALPLRTITEALRIVEDGDTVIVGEGVYHESVRVPGGQAGAVVSLKAADGERVILSGSVPVTGWEKYQDDLYTTVLDFQPKRLLVAYREQPMAREPNEGWWIAEVADELTLTDTVNLMGVTPDFVGGHAYIWTIYGNAFFPVPVEYLDRINGTLTVVRESKWMRLGAGDRYFLRNHPSLIDSPGEWAVQEEGDKFRIYFLPAKPADLTNVEAPRETRAILSVSNAGHVRISGIEIAATARNGIEITRSEDVVVSDCIVHNHGYMGMLLRDVSDVTVRHSVFVANSYGLMLYGATGAVLEENEIARNTTDGLVVSWDSSDVSVCRNYIHHHLLWGHPDNIQLYRNVKDISFVDNLLIGSGQSMMMAQSSDGLIQGNTIVGAVSYSLVVAVDNFQIHNNTIAFSGYGSINLTGQNCDVRENVLVTGHPRTILSTRGSDGYSGDHNLFYNSRRSTDKRVVASEKGWHRSLVEYQRATGQDQSSAYGDPKFFNAPVCFAVVSTRSVADCSRDTLPLGADALSFKVGDNIEIDFDGVLRKVVGRTATTITFSPSFDRARGLIYRHSCVSIGRFRR
ncbi:MAG: right-handed parallel beta-helix repeat-containing protein [Planctomycetota bacterium]